MQPRVLIIGFGLMGGSAGLALRARGWHVAYVDERVPSFEGAEKLDAPREEELVVLATHVDGAVALLPQLQSSGVITSLCSLMKPLRAVAPSNFIAGHPMAGSHLSGIGHATASLYENKTWFLDAHDARVERLVRDCGATPRIVDAGEHDAAMALTSQLPQILSTALAAYLHDQNVLEFAGSGLRDFLRLAGSNVEMWRSILSANRATLAPHADAVAAIVREIVAGDPTDAFTRANELFRTLT
ncbi:MAG TPA: prephenate dehydrogenase/arogenate dehydrogenase family protein [Thermoanaerobaculia bacterium]|nr:prephenate dehydrogenase/arogenate dehydrogenase family protein [Thermoanaerobaculia bacterium]